MITMDTSEEVYGWSNHIQCVIMIIIATVYCCCLCSVHPCMHKCIRTCIHTHALHITLFYCYLHYNRNTEQLITYNYSYNFSKTLHSKLWIVENNVFSKLWHSLQKRSIAGTTVDGSYNSYSKIFICINL